jgi:hypothetical protein
MNRTDVVRNPGMISDETICGVRSFHRIVFRRCVRCLPILPESFEVLRESRTIQIIEPICSTAGSPISITNETMPGFLTTSGQ